MPEEKLKKVIIGVTIAGTLLLTFLFAVIIYQFVCMGVKNSQIKAAEEQIASYEEAKEQLQGNLSYYETEEYKEKIARIYGYVYSEDQTSEDDDSK